MVVPGAKRDVAADRRKQILKAAVEVFAERGFHRTRVSDIAKRAGVAYGLIYHYFDSKDDVLTSVFEENWNVFLKVLRDLEANEEMEAISKLKAISDLLIEALQIAPATIQVIIQEISRSDRFFEAHKSQMVQAFEGAFSVVRDIVAAGKEKGQIKASVDPQVTAHLFFGALETVCTGFMIGTITCCTKEEADQVKNTVGEVMLAGMMTRPEVARAER